MRPRVKVCRAALSVGIAVSLTISVTACRSRDSVSQAPTGQSQPNSGTASAPPRSVGVQYSYADMVDRVAPAVVTIRSARRVRAPQQFPFLDDPFFRQFFGNSRGNRQPEGGSQVQRGLGSGVIVGSDGHIVTNQHVVDGADQISVELTTRRVLNAKLLGADAPSDLALLKVDASDLPVLSLGDSDRVRVGDICLAIGNPLGIGETVTSGIISAKGRATGLSDGTFEDFLQTDAAINRGNSGGALVNTQGELIGINSQIISPSGGNIGIGFAIPSNMTRNVMDQLRNGGKVRRGRLGVGIQEITGDLARSLGLENGRGVLVNSVEKDGPAERAGVRAGDVITAVNGTRVDGTNALRNYVARTAPGSELTMTVLRDGHEQQLRAKVAELRADREAAPASGEPEGSREQLGIAVEPLTGNRAAQLGLGRGTQGLVVSGVAPGGPASAAGIQTEDVILEVNHQPVKSAAELQEAVKRSGSRPALLLVSRGGRNLFIAVTPG